MISEFVTTGLETDGSSLTLPDYAGLEAVMPATICTRLVGRAAPWREPVSTMQSRAGKVARKARMPGRRRAIATRSVCAVVRRLTNELVALAGSPPPFGPTPLDLRWAGSTAHGRNRRFPLSHIRQIAIYVCHVVLQMTMNEIALAFGIDRTTVGHACARVEDRRDDRAYDALVGAIERVVDHVFGRAAATKA